MYHFRGASSNENQALRYNSSSFLVSINSPLKNPIKVSRKHGRYNIRGSWSYYQLLAFQERHTKRGGEFVKDFDSFAAREIFAGIFPCHTFCLNSTFISSLSSAPSSSPRPLIVGECDISPRCIGWRLDADHWFWTIYLGQGPVRISSMDLIWRLPLTICLRQRTSGEVTTLIQWLNGGQIPKIGISSLREYLNKGWAIPTYYSSHPPGERNHRYQQSSSKAS